MPTLPFARNVPVAKYVSTDYYVVRNLSNEQMAKWACNAHKIRQIRHLRGVIARCTSKKIRAIGAIRELLYNKVQISSVYPQFASSDSIRCKRLWRYATLFCNSCFR